MKYASKATMYFNVLLSYASYFLCLIFMELKCMIRHGLQTAKIKNVVMFYFRYIYHELFDKTHVTAKPAYVISHKMSATCAMLQVFRFSWRVKQKRYHFRVSTPCRMISHWRDVLHASWGWLNLVDITSKIVKFIHKFIHYVTWYNIFY
jgi:hypothetical protein